MEDKNIREGKKRRRRDGKSIMMPNLPGEIVDDILFMLPAKSICRFKCVCKQWYELFKNPDFVKSRLKNSIETENFNCFSINCLRFYMHITKSLSMSVFENELCASVKMDYPSELHKTDIKILGSCNGLILIRSYKQAFFIWNPRYWIWNPYTKERKEIVIPIVECDPGYCRETYRSMVLGYNCDTDDYEIVAATCHDSHKHPDDYEIVAPTCHDSHKHPVGCRIQAYTVRTDSWKTVANIVPYRITSSLGNPIEVFVRGVVYWIATKLLSEKRCIVSFDIHGEKFNEVAVTPEVDSFLNDTNSDTQTLGALGGCLCIIGMVAFNIEVWVKKDSNEIALWTKLFIVKTPVVPNQVKLLWEFKNGEVLFVTKEYKYSKHGNTFSHIRDWNCSFVIFDPVSQKCQVTGGIRDTPLRRWNIEAYVERSTVLNSTG